MAKLGKALLEKYPDKPHLRKMVLGKWPKDIEISDVTPLKADALRNYICSKVCTNTALTYFRQIRCVLNMYEISKEVQRQLRTRHEDTYSVFLTEDEIEKIQNYAENAQGSTAWIQKRRMYAFAFIISANTGMRASDTMDITKSNISKGVLTYTSIKTGVTAQIPARKDLLRWIEILKDMMTKYGFDRLDYVKTIKTVCKKCGIDDEVLIHRGGKNIRGPKWKFVGTHTARRSFATNLYLRGLDIYTIGKFLGHRAGSIALTSGYICCNLKPMDENIMSFFKQ